MAVVVGDVPTPEGRAALQAARQEAQDRQQKLVVVNSHKGGSSFDGDEAIKTDEELEAVRSELTASGADFEIMTLVRGNDPTDDLIEVAEQVGAGLIVIGLRRRTPIGKLVLGSNAQKILLEADCPVLSVKAPRDRRRDHCPRRGQQTTHPEVRDHHTTKGPWTSATGPSRCVRGGT